MRILLTGNTDFKIANFRAGLVRALVAEGHELVAVVPAGTHTAVLEEMGCRVVDLKMSRKGKAPHQEAALLLRFLRVFRRERPDVILGFTIKNNLYGAVAARLLGIPFLPNVTGLGTAFAHPGFLRRTVTRLYRIAFSGLPLVFFQNDADRDTFLRLGILSRERTRILPGSGVDMDAFPDTPLPGDDAAPTFLLVARLLKEKGIAELATAAEIVRSAHPGARFQVLGPFDTGNSTAIAPIDMEAWTAAGQIDYLGSARDVRPHLAAADCVVLPTYYPEGTPRALLEGAAMGRPLVTTDWPGCRDTVVDGGTGFLCRPRDAVDLARALSRVAALSAAERATMGQAGRRLMRERFDETFVIAAYRDALAHLCGLPDAELECP